MGTLLSTGSCPFCLSGTKTPCFATYDDGYKCFTCGKIKKTSYAWKPFLINTPSKGVILPVCTQKTGLFSFIVLQWLYKYYVFESLIHKYGIAYVPSIGKMSESVLLPVIINGVVTSYQQRFFPYKSFITKGDKTKPFMIHNSNFPNEVVLVEDFISAIRLGEHVSTICLFGVHISPIMSTFLENLNMNIKIWLDPDEVGVKASKELLAKTTKSMLYYANYRAFAVREPRKVSIIATLKQPKDYSDSEIINILGEVNETVSSH